MEKQMEMSHRERKSLRLARKKNAESKSDLKKQNKKQKQKQKPSAAGLTARQSSNLAQAIFSALTIARPRSESHGGANMRSSHSNTIIHSFFHSWNRNGDFLCNT